MSTSPATSIPPPRLTDRGRILVVDDEPTLLRAYARVLAGEGFTVVRAADGDSAANLLQTEEFDVLVTDLVMPGMGGIELLRLARERNVDLPVVLITATPGIETAVQAIEYGAFRYLLKPVDLDALTETVQKATHLHRLAKIKREAAAQLGGEGLLGCDRAGLEAALNRAEASLWMAYQPIVCWSSRTVHAYEALMRTKEPMLPHPGAVLDAATRIGRLNGLGRLVRDAVATSAGAEATQETLFVNLHPLDLNDDALYRASAPLSRIAERVVLEITERVALDQVSGIRERIGQLRSLGYRVALDDLGAGYAGLLTFAHLEPDIVKVDMSLVRNIDTSPVKQKLIRSILGLCSDMGKPVIAEGVETAAERDTLVGLGCDLLQGYLFAKPGPGFPEAKF